MNSLDSGSATKTGGIENGGRTLAEANVVRSVRFVAHWLGKRLQIPSGFRMVAAVIEAHGGRVVGEARLAGGPT